MKRLLLGTGVLLMTSLLFLNGTPVTLQAQNNDTVRTANYYLLSGTALDTRQAREVLPKFDLLVLPVEAQVYNADFFAHARRVNPDIVILAYVVSTSWNDHYWNDPLHVDMKRGIQSSWWLRDGNGQFTSNWPGLTLLNLNSGWTDYLAEYVSDEVLSSGYWDGVFYDDVGEGISYVSGVDVNRDGQPDDPGTADALWRAGYLNLVRETRRQVGAEPIIITNGSSRGELAPYVNGRMYEAFPTPWEGFWNGTMQKYLQDQQVVQSPIVQIINGTTSNTGNHTDYQDFRYGLTSALLGGGYYGYDFGTQRHADLWYYDEYDAAIGNPVREPVDRLSPGNTRIRESVWERDYSGGKVVVNATNDPHRIRLDGDYEHLRGSQDPVVNNGRIVSSVTVGARDGVVLLRTVENVLDASFINGSFLRIFNGDGSVDRNGFFGFEERALGSENVVRYDTDGDGLRETIIAGDSRVDIFDDNGTLHASFYPYTETYRDGVNIAIGDIENDGSVEIVTGTERGGGPQIRIFNKDGNLIHPGFFAYDTAFRGGVNVAIGDLNGDAVNEVIAGAGVGGGPHVRVFSKDGRVINPGFFAYDPNFRGGVNVAVGDVNGDGIGDIITGPGRGEGPIIRVFDRDGNMSVSFSALDNGGREGIEVSATDLDQDGIDEILGMSQQSFF